MKEGDLIEVEVEQIGILRNRVVREVAVSSNKEAAA